MTSSADKNFVENPAGRILFGRNILVTRPRDQAGSLAELFSFHGAKVLLQPVIEIRPTQNWPDVDAAIKRISEFGWLTFVSVNGVKYFLDRCSELNVHLENRSKFPALKFAAIGLNTARELERRGLTVNLVPEKFDSFGVAESLIDQVKTETVLLVRADRGSEQLSSRLQQAGVSHQEIAVYRSSDVTTVDPEIMSRMKQHDIDWVTVTSSAIAQSTVNLFGEFLRRTKLVSISPTTSKKLCDLSYPPAAEATDFNMPGLVQAIIEFERKP